MPMPVTDMTGKKCGRLTVIERAQTIARKARWLCRCDCGKEITAEGVKLRRNQVRSCGCLLIEISTKHGMAGRKKRSPEYIVWHGMRQRCNNPRSMSYPNYGRRGITVCDRWNISFANFLADMGPRPTPKHTIERLDNDKGYCPENCVWATRDVQGKNTRRVKRLIFQGAPITINEIAARSGYKPKSVATLLRGGRSIEMILERRSQ